MFVATLLTIAVQKLRLAQKTEGGNKGGQERINKPLGKNLNQASESFGDSRQILSVCAAASIDRVSNTVCRPPGVAEQQGVEWRRRRQCGVRCVRMRFVPPLPQPQHTHAARTRQDFPGQGCAGRQATTQQVRPPCSAALLPPPSLPPTSLIMRRRALADSPPSLLPLHHGHGARERDGERQRGRGERKRVRC